MKCFQFKYLQTFLIFRLNYVDISKIKNLTFKAMESVFSDPANKATTMFFKKLSGRFMTLNTVPDLCHLHLWKKTISPF